MPTQYVDVCVCKYATRTEGWYISIRTHHATELHIYNYYTQHTTHNTMEK
jgi:hypothetical protein